MKLRHNTNGYAPDKTDPAWAERVERESEQHTARTEAAWLKAKRRLERAETRAAEAEVQGVGVRRLARMWDAVEARRAELRALERLQTQSPAGSQHRGRGSHRGVSQGEVF